MMKNINSDNSEFLLKHLFVTGSHAKLPSLVALQPTEQSLPKLALKQILLVVK